MLSAASREIKQDLEKAKEEIDQLKSERYVLYWEVCVILRGVAAVDLNLLSRGKKTPKKPQKTKN